MIMRMARMIMRMIKAMRVTGVNIIITITMKTMRVTRMIKRMARIIMRMIKAMRVTEVYIKITITSKTMRMAK